MSGENMAPLFGQEPFVIEVFRNTGIAIEVVRALVAASDCGLSLGPLGGAG